MKKLIKFQPNAKTFFDIAEDKYDEGDYPDAVHYFYRSYLTHRDIESLVALGETYADMGEPERGLKYLFLALDSAPDDPDIRESIAECFFDMGDEETAFFYYRARMSVGHFKRLMEECDIDNEILPPSPIRVIEKDDAVALNIAFKLLQSGDTAYANEVLLTVKPDSEHYIAACNLLSLSALDNNEPADALKYAEKSLEKGDSIDGRCDMMMACHALGEHENAENIADKLERLKLKTEEHRAVAFAYIKMGDAKRALGHLRALYDAGVAGRDSLVSYALAMYDVGQREQARQLMIKAGRTYPEDVTVKVLADAIRERRKLSLYPLLPDELTKEFMESIEDTLALIRMAAGVGWSGDGSGVHVRKGSAAEGEDGESGNKYGTYGKYGNYDADFASDEDFKDKIRWLFQTRFSVSQGRAALTLGRLKSWRPFLCEQLLDNYLDLSAKKSCLLSLLLFGGLDKLGIVIDGLFVRLKPRYPEGMDGRFRAAYCLAFSSYAFSDTGFENRLYVTGNKLLKRYLKHKDALTNEETLAAVIFFAAGHKKIAAPVNCAHLFGCDAEEMKRYMGCLGVRSEE
ncbi:MAG: hypothetical protein FWE84_00475 [Firmicutes bacterium]|nr:hypothetical protein [Bacillota bacterium]